jgi:rhodanese-related sulfurtransferase
LILEAQWSKIVTVETPWLGDRTYLATDGAGSVHVPLQKLAGRMREMSRAPLWVHCQAGCRASIAASLLQAAGHIVIAVDDLGRAADAGLPITGRSGHATAAVA